MSVIRVVRALSLCLGLCVLPGIALATDCSGLPTSFTGGEFPTGDFFSNFDNPCYTINLGAGVGNTEYCDLNATYYQLYYQVNPKYELILVGTFPNTRYFSVALNDAHSALSESILDTSIVPLTSQYINPYMPGVPYVAGQQYAVPISFGGIPGKEETGCRSTGYNLKPNGLDATLRHPGMDWNNDAGFFQQFPGVPNHAVDTPQHTNPNTGGVLMIRAYMDDTAGSYATNPHVILRDVASGCAYPAAYALNTLQIVTDNASSGGAWLDQNQFAVHHTYETSYLPKFCNASPPPSDNLEWSRQPEYVPASNPNAAYIVANVPPGLPATLAVAGEAMRIRVRIPTTPPTPCASGCSRSGDEQMRYMSLSFTAPNGQTIASIADSAFTKDAHGYATLIVGTGAAIPDWITAANGYTFLDLTALPNYQQLVFLSMRHIIPKQGLTCAGQFIPYRTAVDTPAGSLLGDYTPVVDYPAAVTLPQRATPLKGPNACGDFPDGQPGVRPACGVFSAPPPSISSVTTQCLALGCTQFAAEPNPPITIVGAGFGTFPDGAPFTGTSKYLGLVDVTQGWYAGMAGTPCTVSISEWDAGQVQFVANVPTRSGKCAIQSGDDIEFEVWNPQTMVLATFETTAE
jgi:hypothetical protein